MRSTATVIATGTSSPYIHGMGAHVGCAAYRRRRIRR
jgi:hypothetical protein